MSTAKIALITGGNSGIGYGIAQRLLDHSVKNPGDQFHIVLACRNQTRAINAQNELLKEFPEGSVEIVLVDVTSVESVFKCCKEIKERFNRIDLFFCNAGALPCLYVDRWLIVKQMIFNPITLLSKSDVVVQPVGKTTTEGLGETFACNLFGHYVMIRELEDLLFKAKGRIIWTGSSVTAKRDLDMKDYQAVNGKAPYESSKRIVDLISIGLNSRLNKRNVYSFTTHPGVAATNIVRDHIGLAMGYMMEMALYTARTLGMRIQTITNWNGSYANYYVATQPIESLNTTLKYGSYCSPLGNVYVDTDVVEEYDEVETEVLISKLENLLDNFRNKYMQIRP